MFSVIFLSISVNWGAIMDEICRSNIMQRDNKKFAQKLDKSLAELAKEKNKTVSIVLGGLESYKQERMVCVCCPASEETNSANF
jgi:hypothetical protein